MFGILVLGLSTAAFLFGRFGCDGQTADVGSLTSQIGGYAVFKCPAVPQPRFDHDGGLRRLVAVRWTKDGQTVFTCSEGTLTTDERYDGRTTVVEPPEFSDAVYIAINVSSLRESDTGDYECHVTYSGDAGPLQHSSSRAPLPTLSSPQSSTDSTLNAVDNDMGATAGVRFRLDVEGGDVMSIPPINQTRMEHESVHFSCVKEDPEFVVQWYKDGIPLDDLPFLNGRFLVTPEGSLDIYDAALNDNGFYSCRIVSEKGTLTAGAFLNVQFKAKVVYSPAEVFLAYGKPGTLDCHFHSNPPLTKIRWEKDGFLFDTYNVPGVYHTLNGSLYFDRVEKEHGGKYTCTPFNDLGTEGPSTPMDVIVQHPPKLIVVPKVLYFRKLGDNITMPCEAEHFDNRGPAIVWQKADGKSLFYPRVTVTGGNLTLTGVRSEDRGVYRCVASNIAATISVETELIVEENLFHRKHFDLHVNSTNKNIVAYWKRPYSFCTVWSRDTSSASSNWNATATSSDGKAILWNLNTGGEYEIMVSCQDEMTGESMFSRSILTSQSKETIGQLTEELHEKPPSLVDDNHPFDIRVERSGTGYNVSWITNKSSTEHRIKRYEVKWYDAHDGSELGSVSTEANKRYIVVELAGGKTYGIVVTATSTDGRQTFVGSRSFHSSAAALAATTTSSSSPSTAFTKYYYMVLFGLLIAGFVVLCCNCCSGKDR
ncbi:protein borderless isoform X1 [Aphis gossypii]|uniref:protein borderless isoform X1 n=1 Tax=Aphis gossypii TaxID=80765 RepID=UPI0021592635|nr:protein borderless isoform X1 [Aphis gossypii]